MEEQEYSAHSKKKNVIFSGRETLSIETAQINDLVLLTWFPAQELVCLSCGFAVLQHRMS